MLISPQSVLSRVAVERREYLQRRLPRFGSILELGAFDNPVFRKELGDMVKYADWFGKEELLDMHKSNHKRNFNRAVDVDYVIKDHLFARHVDAKFDLISGSHVIEHIADVVTWLKEIEALLRPGGAVFLAIPDRRYTFDYFRSESTAIQMVRAHEEKLSRPDKWQIFDHFYYHQKVDAEAIWNGMPPSEFKSRFSFSEAIKRSEIASNEYTDAHCWVFTPSSFEIAINDLRLPGLVGLSVEHVEPTRRGRNEFWTVLRK
ncbi:MULTISPECIES: methyltransferase domain-containing protein [unclassified Mesorhizobium]|uniref:class I SAM-dependent methyltransferase n=1 Tax=unclassified Mesorhizobium TaxID=325217 RepID=UPI000FD19887|nr:MULTISPECIES: methyltransferase domain-containing protein [unclassified Mesorhizobium]RVB80553.1 methyltransferase domain-containing protein [Mesorhizobium sp. M6A.T.Cr.TU.014.01.1.1]RWP97589.1 MAG: methyltransferase domain-containing protein [Mesorhizobium sp.]RWQ10861.1 MAG: methyltransferase domain-containing protein [Mesorhizobium sp.]